MTNGQTSNRTGETSGEIRGRRQPTHRAARLAVSTMLMLQVHAGESATARPVVSAPSACCAATTPRPDRWSERVEKVERTPDRVAEYVGGIAARLRTDERLVPGRLYLLMAAPGSEEPARLYEQSPYTHDRGTHEDTIESNDLASETAESITGTNLERIDFTSAPGGGPSGGLIYLIAYLNLISDGAFTADVRVAATGRLEAEGYVGHITSPDAKLAAAHHARADVLFTPSTPLSEAIAEHADRQAGQRFRSRHGRVTLDVERALDEYHAWGATRPAELDVIVVGHIADVAAYLCGAGSEYACEITHELGATMTLDTITWFDVARATHTPDDAPAHGHPSLGALN